MTSGESSGPTVGVGAVVLKDDALLMVQRGREPGRGLWSLPGGRVEHGEYLTDAVAREIREETGVAIRVKDLLGIYEIVGRGHYVVLDYSAEPIGDDEPVAAGDAAQARWVPLHEIKELDCTPRFVETLSGWGVLPSADV